MTEVIASDADAYRWLSQYLQEGAVEGVRLENWPNLTIRLTGEKFHNSLTPSVMKGFVDYQNSIYRAYALARYGVPDVRKLSTEERDALDLVIVVDEGSSILGVDFQDTVDKLLGPVGDKMEPSHLIMLLLGFGLLWAGKESYKSYLNHRRRIREAELNSDDRRNSLQQVEALSAQETERLRILNGMIKKSPQFRNMASLAYDGKTDLLKALAHADVVEIDGVEVDGNVIKELVTNARRKSEQVRLDGDYLVQRVDTSSPNTVKVKIKGATSGLTLEALILDRALTLEARTMLQEAEWGRTPVKLKVGAKVVFNEIKSAEIIGVGDAVAVGDDPAEPDLDE